MSEAARAIGYGTKGDSRVKVKLSLFASRQKGESGGGWMPAICGVIPANVACPGEGGG